jgi:hypothetical protein
LAHTAQLHSIILVVSVYRLVGGVVVLRRTVVVPVLKLSQAGQDGRFHVGRFLYRAQVFPGQGIAFHRRGSRSHDFLGLPLLEILLVYQIALIVLVLFTTATEKILFALIDLGMLLKIMHLVNL